MKLKKVRISEEAHRFSKSQAAKKGLSQQKYLSQLALEASKADKKNKRYPGVF